MTVAGVPRDVRLLFFARALRTAGFGGLSVVLALFLEANGMSAQQIGLVLSATLLEDALLTAAVSLGVNRIGRRRALRLASWLIVFAGLALAVAERRDVLAVAAVLGMLSPSGQDAGPFSPLEQATLSAPPRRLARLFAWYNVAGLLPAALGALCAGLWLAAARALGMSELQGYRALLLAYAAGGAVLAALYGKLSPAVEAADAPPARRWSWSLPLQPLQRSRRVVFELAALQALDSLAGGFVIQAFLAFWLHLRFGVGPELLGPLFFAANLLSAGSFLAAARIAERFGLLRTMVFTHLPSNLLLMLVPLMPTLTLAALVLLARQLLSQMDVPTRQAYAMVLVDPRERAAAAGLTTSARGIAQAAAPALSALSLSSAAAGAPFFLAGGLKIVYDLALYLRFRGVALPRTSAAAAQETQPSG